VMASLKCVLVLAVVAAAVLVAEGMTAEERRIFMEQRAQRIQNRNLNRMNYIVNRELSFINRMNAPACRVPGQRRITYSPTGDYSEKMAKYNARLNSLRSQISALCVAAIEDDVEETSAESTSAESTSAESTSAESTSAESTSAESTSAESTSAESTSAEETSAEATSAEVTSAGVTSAEVTSAEVTSAEVTSAETTSFEV